jgi:hypothetical protein
MAGPSPLLSGSLIWDDVGYQLDLSAATSFNVGIGSRGLTFGFVGPGFIFSDSYGPAIDAGSSLSTAYSTTCHCAEPIFFSGGGFASGPTIGIDIYTETLTPLGPSPVPEPATWAMLILGFFGLGHALRRSGRSFIPTRVA